MKSVCLFFCLSALNKGACNCSVVVVARLASAKSLSPCARSFVRWYYCRSCCALIVVASEAGGDCLSVSRCWPASPLKQRLRLMIAHWINYFMSHAGLSCKGSRQCVCL